MQAAVKRKMLECLIRIDQPCIEIQKDDAIKRNQIFFDFMLRIFNHINQLYEKKGSLLIELILRC